MSLNRSLKACALAIASMISSRVVMAELTFSEVRVEQTADPKQEAATAVFRFQNTGAKPVSIVDLNTSCRCISASTAKQTYAPGERGEVVAKLVLTAGEELEEKSVYVLTDAAPAKPQPLVLVVRKSEPAKTRRP